MKSAAQWTPLSEADWNFDNVSDEELVACCYWEYARESAFIRDVKRRCIDPRWRKMTNTEPWDHCGYDIERIQSIGYASQVFLSGFFFDETEDRKPRHPDAAPITGGFPCPWQSLTEAERKNRARIQTDREAIPLVPFRRGYAFCAGDIARALQCGQSLKDDQTGEPIPSLLMGGSEIGLFQIEWEAFTNDELRGGFARWLRQNRPRRLPLPDGRGHKPRDLRAALDRLGMMRLLHYFTLREMRERCPAGWKAFEGYEWFKESKRAGARFRELFPFLPPSERPLSWPTKGGRRK